MSEDESFAQGKQADRRVGTASSSSDAHAEIQRQHILDAAREAFFDRGYPATTVEEIASRARVVPGMVHDVLGGTRGALSALIDIAVHGGDSPIHALERFEAQRLPSETGQRAQLEMLAAMVAGTLERVGPTYLIMRHAAHSDHGVALAYTNLHDAERQNMGIVAGWIGANGPLKGGMPVEMAADVLWTLTGADVHHLLRVHREWSAEQYREWLAVTLIASLLP